MTRVMPPSPGAAPPVRPVAAWSARADAWIRYLRQQRRWVLAAALLAFAALALDVLVWRHPAPLPADIGATLWLQHLVLPQRTLTLLLNQPSELTWPLPATLTTVAVVGLLLLLRRWLDALALTAIPAADSAVTYLTTLLVQRPRPMGFGVQVQLLVQGFYSYPSGHVAHAVTFFGLLAFLTYRVCRPGWWVWPLRVALVAVIVLMGPSRLLEGEHWLSDVVAGYLYGAFWLLVGIHAFDAVARRWPRLLAAGERVPEEERGQRAGGAARAVRPAAHAAVPRAGETGRARTLFHHRTTGG